MMKLKYASIFSGVFAVSLSAHAATMVRINDDTIDNYLTVSGKNLVAPDNNYKFALTKKITLSNGLVKNKYVLFYKNIPVFNGILSSSEIDGKTINWFGQMVIDIQDDLNDVTPSYTQEAILKIAKEHFKLTKTDIVKNEEAVLLVRMNTVNEAELIYLVSFNVEGNRTERPNYIINAKNGEIISSWDGLTTQNAEGPGGNQRTGSYYYGRDFSYLDVSDTCAMTNATVETYDMKNQTSGNGTLFKFNCPVNNYKQVNGAFSPLNDAHYFAGRVFDMYKTWFGISPLKTKLKLRVHYGNNFENAFWDGQQMTFGDGGTRMYPFTGLDVMAHEVSHGVTEQNSGLVYEKQSGGINEAFSDMAGEAVEYYMNQQNGKENDWLVGATIMKGTGDAALRYFKNPSKDGSSIENASDYNDSLDVHHSSGVFNKAFYLLSTKPNWEIKKAFATFLAANQVYWEPEATYNTAACGVAKAAADLKYEVNDVIASFKAVGVDANCQLPDPDTGKEIELTNGTVLNNIKTKANEERRYFIKVPVVRTYPYSYDLLYIRAFNSANNSSSMIELFVRYGRDIIKKVEPTPLAGGDEVFQINKPAAGTYHILIKGKKEGSINLSALYGNTK